MSMEYFGILLQKAQKAPRILAVDKGIPITDLKFLLQLRLAACLAEILEYLALYMFLK